MIIRHFTWIPEICTLSVFFQAGLLDFLVDKSQNGRMPTTTSYPNRYDGPCVVCHQTVPEGVGNIQRTGPLRNGRRAWQVRHNDGQCPTPGIAFEAVGTPTVGTTHFVAPSVNLDTSWDLRTLPRPSRDRMHVYGTQNSTTAFRIVRNPNGSMRVYGTQIVSRRNYRSFPDLVGWQGANDTNMRYNSTNARARYADELTTVLDNPAAAVERYGRIIGRCGHCGRTLTNPESVERGIGPICYSRMISSRWGADITITPPAPRTHCMHATNGVRDCQDPTINGGVTCARHTAVPASQRLADWMCRESGCTRAVPLRGDYCSMHSFAGSQVADDDEIRRALARNIIRTDSAPAQLSLLMDELTGTEIR